MRKIKLIALLSISFILFSSQKPEEIKIIEKPISYNLERQKLSLEYLKEHHSLIQKSPTITPKIIVLHYTAGGTIKSNFDYFNNTFINSERKVLKNKSKLNVSSHYLVDRNGTIYHILADTLFARHTIGLNYCAIGVENIGSEKEPLTKLQVIANANLIRKLYHKYKIEYVIGHSEYGKFRNTKLWKESDTKYFTGKADPGENFLIDVRKSITDLNLKSKP